MSNIHVEKCPVCGEEDSKYVCYAPQRDGNESLYTLDEDNEYSPLILFKRVECSKCGATVNALTITCDQAIEVWNECVKNNKILKRVGEEQVTFSSVR